MLLYQFILLIIYSIWSIYSIYTIIKYPKAIFKYTWNLTSILKSQDLKGNIKYNERFRDSADREWLTPISNVWIIFNALIIFFTVVVYLLNNVNWTYKVF